MAVFKPWGRRRRDEKMGGKHERWKQREGERNHEGEEERGRESETEKGDKVSSCSSIFAVFTGPTEQDEKSHCTCSAEFQGSLMSLISTPSLFSSLLTSLSSPSLKGGLCDL